MIPELEQHIDSLYGYVGRHVRDARLRAGLTQSQLADVVDMTRSSVANLEAGRQRIPLHVLVLMAEFLKVKPVELLPDSPVFDTTTPMPDLSEELANDREGMRNFVHATVAKAVVDTQSRADS